MNEKSVIRAIYTVDFSTFNFICWIIISNVFLHMDLFILNTIFIVVNIIYIYKNAINIDYSECRDKIIKRIYALVLVGIGIMVFQSSLMATILKGELIFFITSIWLLRSVRRHSQGTTSGKSFIYDLILMTFIALLSYDKLLKFIIKILDFIWKYISYVLDKTIYIFALIIGYPITVLTNLLGNMYQKHTKQISEYLNPAGSKNKAADIANISGHSSYLSYFIKIILLLVIVIIVFKSVSKNKNEEKNNDIDSAEVRERIKSNKSNISKAFTEILDFISPRDIRTQILYIYRSFQKKAQAKHIYKPSMTAKELSEEFCNITDDDITAKELSYIYNKAKFSNHNMDNEELIKVKNLFSIIKKRM
jgi:hypothetical protein